ELTQHLRRREIDPLVGVEAELLVGVDRVEPGILELVGAQLVDQADAAALLREIEQNAAARLGDRGDGAAQLLAQSQRRLPSRSPVKHSECSRTRTGASPSGVPIRIARCSLPPSPGRKATRRASSAPCSGTRASVTRASPAIAARRRITASASTTAKSARRRASAAAAGPRLNTTAAGSSAASLAR